jgi:hypothetical protein
MRAERRYRERNNVRFEREQEWVEMPTALKEMVIIIII